MPAKHWKGAGETIHGFLSPNGRRLASYEVTGVILRISGLRSEEGVRSAQQSVLTLGLQEVDWGQSPSTSEDDNLMSWSVYNALAY